jgi:hypothetical protein
MQISIIVNAMTLAKNEFENVDSLENSVQKVSFGILRHLPCQTHVSMSPVVVRQS